MKILFLVQHIKNTITSRLEDMNSVFSEFLYYNYGCNHLKQERMRESRSRVEDDGSIIVAPLKLLDGPGVPTWCIINHGSSKGTKPLVQCLSAE